MCSYTVRMNKRCWFTISSSVADFGIIRFRRRVLRVVFTLRRHTNLEWSRPSKTFVGLEWFLRSRENKMCSIYYSAIHKSKFGCISQSWSKGMKKQYFISGVAITILGVLLIPIVSFLDGFPVCLCFSNGGIYYSVLRIIAAPTLVIGAGLILVGLFSVDNFHVRKMKVSQSEISW